MAIDTRNERASILNYSLPWGVYPNPDGTLDQADRQQIAALYPGILAQVAALANGFVHSTFTSKTPGGTFTSKTPTATFTTEAT